MGDCPHCKTALSQQKDLFDAPSEVYLCPTCDRLYELRSYGLIQSSHMRTTDRQRTKEAIQRVLKLLRSKLPAPLPKAHAIQMCILTLEELLSD